MNQGRGIYLIRDIDELKKTLGERDEKQRKSLRPGMERIVQRYITNPLLLEGRKFDIRAYLLIANTVPYLVMYHKGYVRLCLQEYSNDAENLTAHLTNQFIQKKDAGYQDLKEDTVWTMDKFNEYINEVVAPEKNLERDWVHNCLSCRMKQIMLYCFKSVKHKLKCRLGYFDLYGLDFMIDQDMKVWLIEVNVNPSLSTNCAALREVIPSMVRETIHVALECFEKGRRGKPLMPLQALKDFQILYNASVPRSRPTTRTSGTLTPLQGSPVSYQRSRSISPMQQRSKSLSPVRDIGLPGQGNMQESAEGQGQANISQTFPRLKVGLHNNHVRQAFVPTPIMPLAQATAAQTVNLAGFTTISAGRCYGDQAVQVTFTQSAGATPGQRSIDHEPTRNRLARIGVENVAKSPRTPSQIPGQANPTLPKKTIPKSEIIQVYLQQQHQHQRNEIKPARPPIVPKPPTVVMPQVQIQYRQSSPKPTVPSQPPRLSVSLCGPVPLQPEDANIPSENLQLGTASGSTSLQNLPFPLTHISNLEKVTNGESPALGPEDALLMQNLGDPINQSRNLIPVPPLVDPNQNACQLDKPQEDPINSNEQSLSVNATSVISTEKAEDGDAWPGKEQNIVASAQLESALTKGGKHKSNLNSKSESNRTLVIAKLVKNATKQEAKSNELKPESIARSQTPNIDVLRNLFPKSQLRSNTHIASSSGGNSSTSLASRSQQQLVHSLPAMPPPPPTHTHGNSTTQTQNKHQHQHQQKQQQQQQKQQQQQQQQQQKQQHEQNRPSHEPSKKLSKGKAEGTANATDKRH